MIQTIDGRPRSPRHGFGIEESKVLPAVCVVTKKKRRRVGAVQTYVSESFTTNPQMRGKRLHDS